MEFMCQDIANSEIKKSRFPKIVPNNKEYGIVQIEQLFFREVLRCLPFNGIKIKDFAFQVNIAPQTIYNYMNGQRPSEKTYKYILYVVEKNYPKVIEQAKELMEVN